MHFERNLKRSIYPPWKGNYIDYAKLKRLLRDDGSDAGSTSARHDPDDQWTDEDEGAFVEELVNVQLEKVHNFQSTTLDDLRERTSACEAELDTIVTKEKQQEGEEATAPQELDEDTKKTLHNVLTKLDGITKEMNELEKFSRINYTGFMKATKKHDRRRGHAYRVRPLMQVRLSALPFNKEDYSPLLFRLSTMYTFVRHRLDEQEIARGTSISMSQADSETFTSHRCKKKEKYIPEPANGILVWVHPENLLELRTVILRRLPVLIYNPQTSKIAEGGQRDPTITSLYFDNPTFDLYNAKIDHSPEANSLRLRWYDHLSTNPDIYVEQKTVYEDDTGKEQRFMTRSKYISPFIFGDYKMEKEVQRLRDRLGPHSEQAAKLQSTADDIKEFIKANDLQPMVRANYTRQAFQIPGDNRVRITIDTELAFIREDALDEERPCREPGAWHRRDIDDGDMEYPFDAIRKGEISRFPFAVLEIRIKGAKEYEWVTDLMSSHLVRHAPRFSKFVHGVSQLLDDHVNAYPFWYNDVDTDIRIDPHQAFEEEQERRAKAAQDESAVGSLLRTRASPSPLFRPSLRSPAGSPRRDSPLPRTLDLPRRATAEMTKLASSKGASTQMDETADEPDEDEDDVDAPSGGLASFLPALSVSRYASARRQGHARLPPGVYEPSFWIKDEGPVKVEAKVWLANQRTFIKWQHVAVLLASLSLGLFNAAGADNGVARTLGIVYTALAVFIAVWGWGIYMHRTRLIEARSGRDFDNVIGPVVVCIGLIVALCVNFGFKYRLALEQRREAAPQPSGRAVGL